ncbi:MAG: hypothetical protein Kow0074_23620 [Candidatus Zixiibacteriota bacterium]
MSGTPEFTGRLADAIASGPTRRAATAVVIIVVAALTSYHTTVAGIELALSDKADRAAVESLSQRLLTIETLLRTDVAQRGELIELRDEMQRRLTRIETLLEHKPAQSGATIP